MESKITFRHLQKPAYIYLRQSSMDQVFHHQESTQRQYALQDRAISLGWAPTKIRVLDRDLGVSGAQTSGREDFKCLVADVSMGQVGAVFVLEASRLARSNADWHRVIELCSLTNTLIIDEDGCCDPSDFNDRLLLGLKGTMSEAELHFMRARLHGGKRHKAEKGELRLPLPVGLCYDDRGQIVLDEDAQVRSTLTLFFRTFREVGSANAVVKQFDRQGLLYPKRAHGGAWNGKLTWGRLALYRALSALKNPAYAGVYAFGRHQCYKEILEDGEVRSRIRKMPREQWLVQIRNHHPGYISFEEYLENMDMLQQNINASEPVPGPVREGMCLLHGLLLCGKCGHRLTVHYRGKGRIRSYYTCWGQRYSDTTKGRCMSMRGDLVDRAVEERVLQIVGREELELALQAFEELRGRQQAVNQQWQLRLRRAEYEAALAQRRYEQVDPANRLVAATLEQRWNEALAELDEARKAWQDYQSLQPNTITERQRQGILSLAKNLPRLWHAAKTSPRDKKRILRLLIKDITVEQKPSASEIVLHVRWQGGACEDLVVKAPPRPHYPKAILDRISRLAEVQMDAQIADTLNREGLRSACDKPFTRDLIHLIRQRFGLPPSRQKRPGEVSVPEIATRFGVRRNVVYHWIAIGLLPARRVGPRAHYWITLDHRKTQEIWKYIRSSPKLQGQCNGPSKQSR